MKVTGLDIGGANLKAATGDGDVVSIAFPFWSRRDDFPEVLRTIQLDGHSSPDVIALTMTAELADCFRSKSEGVKFIIDSVTGAFPKSLIRVWLTSGEFAEPADAIELSQLAAASNWHALATWIGRAFPVGPALLIDVGSTTTDVIPILDGIPVSEGYTDLERLLHRELCYTGIRRTPICAVAQEVPLSDDAGIAASVPAGSSLPRMVPLAAEFFATMLDVYLITGHLAPSEKSHNTADGRSESRDAAFNRLAHMLCCDREELTDDQLLRIAEFLADRQQAQIAVAVRDRCEYLNRLTDPQKLPVQILLSGEGAWLASDAIRRIGNIPFALPADISQMFVRDISSCAPAFAVARLAAERCRDDLLPFATL